MRVTASMVLILSAWLRATLCSPRASLAVLPGHSAAIRPEPTSRPATRPTTRTAAFQPGVWINWPDRQVQIDATVVMRDGALELFACSPNTREYESILRVNARPWHIYQAMGLIGLRPGAPLGWDEQAQRVIPPTGETVDLFVRYTLGKQTGPRRPGPSPLATRPSSRTVNVCDWMWDENAKRPMARRSWVFAGSIRFDDGTFAADVEGTVVAVVDFASALMALAESHTADNAALWLRPNTDQIPPVGTSCTLIIRPATPERTTTRTSGTRPSSASQITIIIDRFGRYTCGPSLQPSDEPTPTQPDDFRLKRPQAEAFESRIADALAADPHLRVLVLAAPTTADRDVRRAREQLIGLGVREQAITLKRDPRLDVPALDADAVAELLRERIDLHRAMIEQLASQRERLTQAFVARRDAAREQAQRIAAFLRRIRQQFEPQDLDGQDAGERPRAGGPLPRPQPETDPSGPKKPRD